MTFIERYEIEVNETLAGGKTRTFAQYPYEERLPIWASYYEKMAKYLYRIKIEKIQRVLSEN